MFERRAYIQQFREKGGAMFDDSLGEFHDSANVVQALVDEYEAARRPDYITNPLVG